MKAMSYMILLVFLLHSTFPGPFVYNAQQQSWKQIGVYIGWSMELVKISNLHGLFI